MDLHAFHIIAKELSEALDGARIEKIHAPLPGAHVFSLFAQGLRFRLFMRHERKAPLLFFSTRKIENPPRPSALTMRLRKHFAGRRLGRGLVHPTERRMLFPLLHSSPYPEEGGESNGRELTTACLLLDFASGPDVLFDVPDEYGTGPVWPDPETVDALCASPMAGAEREGPWRKYAVLTPMLRETLSFLEPLEGRALMVDLEAGGGELFLYADKSGRAALCAAWPLPPEVMSRRSLRPCTVEEASLLAEMDDPSAQDDEARNRRARFRGLCPATYAYSLADERRFFDAYSASAQKQEAAPEKKAAKKQARLLAKLEEEEKRLQAMFALREKALGLQAVLWRHAPDARLASVELPGGEILELNPLLSVRENMARMFHQSGRGKRGLAMLEQRRADLAAGAGESKRGRSAAGEGGGVEGPASGPRLVEAPSDAREHKDVARFISSEGFAVLRGKNAKGNRSLLKIGKGHDLWLHVEEGPGAHVIIRRAHEGEAVPEATLMEAAGLAAEKSWQGAGDGVRVMYALLRHVHPMKGGGPGMVKIDKLAGVLSLKTPDA